MALCVCPTNLSDRMSLQRPTPCSFLITLALFPFLKHVSFILTSEPLHLLFPLPGTCFSRSLKSRLFLVIQGSAPTSPPLGSPLCSHSHIIALHCYLHGPVSLLCFPISCPFVPLRGGPMVCIQPEATDVGHMRACVMACLCAIVGKVGLGAGPPGPQALRVLS